MKKEFGSLNRAIDGITMYRVLLYSLGAIILWALGASLLGFLSISPLGLFASFCVIGASALLSHYVFSYLTKAPANVESTIITALLLFLILTPSTDTSTLLMNAVTSVFAIASKYVFVYRLRHVFNPVAIGLVIVGLMGYIGVEWWVASRYMLPIVLVAALAILIKTDRWRLVGTYIVVSTLIALFLFREFATVTEALALHFISWPTLFFAALMLTEPLGLPSRRRFQYVYAGIVAVFSTVPFAFGPLHGTPELALVLGNLFTLAVDRPTRFKLTFSRRIAVGPETYEYRFSPSHKVTHEAGQYLEWTRTHNPTDARGIRRYLTIVTPPGSDEVGFAIKHLPTQSSWKRAVAELTTGDTLFATGRAGDFVLRDTAPLVFIAGGIGITPFMSMLRAKANANTPFPGTLFFCNNTIDERCYVEELEAARVRGFNTVYVTTTQTNTPLLPNEERGFITADTLAKHVPDWREATYYISGPPGMVAAYEGLLLKNNLPRRHIVTDYFPGLA